MKTELVVFLRPTVISNPSLASEELRFLERFLPRPEPAPPPPEGMPSSFLPPSQQLQERPAAAESAR
jgi:type II secretory pathway component GspD/PulD (secretin)